MDGFSPCVPFTPFQGVGGRGGPGPMTNFSEDDNMGGGSDMGPPQPQGQEYHNQIDPANNTPGFQAGAFRGFRNTYDNNPIGCLQERMQK